MQVARSACELLENQALNQMQIAAVIALHKLVIVTAPGDSGDIGCLLQCKQMLRALLQLDGLRNNTKCLPVLH